MPHCRFSRWSPRKPAKRWTRARHYSPHPRFRKQRSRSLIDRLFPYMLVALPLATFSAVFLFESPPDAQAFQRSYDRESANFAICSGPIRTTCIIDGDTIWYRGEKIRIADINTPEAGSPQCAEEARLARRATLRLQALLNEGSFTLASNPDGRTVDRYGRSLRVITRNGQSLGDQLVKEGLAERWKGYRGSWC